MPIHIRIGHRRHDDPSPDNRPSFDVVGAVIEVLGKRLSGPDAPQTYKNMGAVVSLAWTGSGDLQVFYATPEKLLRSLENRMRVDEKIALNLVLQSFGVRVIETNIFLASRDVTKAAAAVIVAGNRPANDSAEAVRYAAVAAE